MDAGKAKFLLPSPNFGKKQDEASKAKPLYLTPSGMTLLTRDKQPPPMYGARGATVPPKFMHEHGRRPKEVLNQQQPHVPQPQPQVNVGAPPEPQYCKSCDMTLQTPDDMKRHRSQHEQCPADGCTFYGLASVMDKHVTAEHSTGLYDNVKKFSTPEEIAAWREERKKKYPTLANIELKQKAREQRQRRGERLEASRERFGKHEDRRRAQHTEKPQDEERGDNRGNPDGRGDRRNDRKRKRRRPNAEHKGEKVAKMAENSVKTDKKESTEVRSVVQRELEENLCDGVPAFRGTAGMKDYKHFKAKPKNVLSSLVGMYGSDDDDDEDDVSDDGDCEEDSKVTEEKLTEKEETHDEKMQDEEGLHEPMVAESVPEIIEETEIVEEPKIIEEPSIEANVTPTPPQECINDDEEPPPYQNGSSDEGPDEAPISHKSLQPDLPEPKPPAAVSTPQESTKKPEKPTKRPQPRKITRTTGLNYRLLRLKNQNTMLEKLLEQDVRHERNVLLQCVRFVCENKFFGIGQASGGDQK